LIRRRLLDEAGYMDRDGDGWREDSEGNRISLILNTNSGNRIREAIGEIFCQEAAKVGIEIVFKPIDFNTMVTKLNSSYDWEMILIGLTGGPDPGEGSNVYPSRGSLHMIEPGQEMPRREWEIRVDDAWDIANLTIDEEQRKKGFVEFQKIWIEEVPWVYTYCAAVMHSYKTIFGNIKPHPMNAYGMKNILSRMYLKD
jgi:peptide/nickel transport system substrate-binding protein